jgi:hypothetical protein
MLWGGYMRNFMICALCQGLLGSENQTMMMSVEHVAVTIYQTRQAVYDQRERRVAFA